MVKSLQTLHLKKLSRDLQIKERPDTNSNHELWVEFLRKLGSDPAYKVVDVIVRDAPMLDLIFSHSEIYIKGNNGVE